MKEKLRFLGLDVHAETIAVAVAEPDGEVRSLGTIPNRSESIRKLIKKLGSADKLRVCYEAGPTGYVVYWQLAELGVVCEVVAPTLVPVKAGDRVKTDRRDAEKLARCYRSGDLTAVWVPDEGSEALRDLVRAREAAKQDQTRARHRLSKFLLRSGQRPPSGVRSWTRPYLIWVAQLRFSQIAQEFTRLDYLHEVEHMRERVARLEQAITEAVKLASPELQQVINDLQALRGIADISAVTIAAELGQVSRFDSARQLMGYCGVVPSEDSSGKRTRRGSITKTGNAHLRRIVVEAAWSYRRPPGVWYGLRRRQETISQETKEIVWKAQHRLHKRSLGSIRNDIYRNNLFSRSRLRNAPAPCVQRMHAQPTHRAKLFAPQTTLLKLRYHTCYLCTAAPTKRWDNSVRIHPYTSTQRENKRKNGVARMDTVERHGHQWWSKKWSPLPFY